MDSRHDATSTGGCPAARLMLLTMRAWLLAPVLFLAACASNDVAFVPSDSSAAVVRWQRASSSLVFDGVFARSASGAVKAQIYKGSTAPLLTLSLNEESVLRASGPLARFGWSGPSPSTPVPLSTWARVMEIYRSTNTWPDGAREIHGSGTRSILTSAKGHLTSLAVTNDLNGETITINFRADGN